DRLRLLACFLIEVGCNVRRWWRGWRAHKLIEYPRSPQNGRRAVAVGSPQQDRALAQQAPPLFLGQRHLSELGADNSGNAVMARKPFVQERVVGSQQVHNASIFQQNAAQEILG